MHVSRPKEDDRRMAFCESCGHRTIPDESGLCDRCLVIEWSELRHRRNIWDTDALRQAWDERPLPHPRRPARPSTRKARSPEPTRP